MAAPIAAIIAREALAKFGDQLPAGVKEAINFVDSPKRAIQGMVRDAIKDRVKDEVMGGYDQHQFTENYFPRSGGGGSGKPRFDEEGMSVEAFKRGGKVKSAAKSKVSTASSRGDGIAQRGKTRGRHV
jgi:hypothetical protein